MISPSAPLPPLRSTDEPRLPVLSDDYFFDARMAYTLYRDDRVVTSRLLMSGLCNLVVPKIGQPEGNWRRISLSTPTRCAAGWREAGPNQIPLPSSTELCGRLLAAQLQAVFNELAPRWSARSVGKEDHARKWTTVKLRVLIEAGHSSASVKGSTLTLKSSSGLILLLRHGIKLPSLDDQAAFEEGDLDEDSYPTNTELKHLWTQIKRRLDALDAI